MTKDHAQPPTNVDKSVIDLTDVGDEIRVGAEEEEEVGAKMRTYTLDEVNHFLEEWQDGEQDDDDESLFNAVIESSELDDDTDEANLKRKAFSILHFYSLYCIRGIFGWV